MKKCYSLNISGKWSQAWTKLRQNSCLFQNCTSPLVHDFSSKVLHYRVPRSNPLCSTCQYVILWPWPHHLVAPKSIPGITHNTSGPYFSTCPTEMSISNRQEFFILYYFPGCIAVYRQSQKGICKYIGFRSMYWSRNTSSLVATMLQLCTMSLLSVLSPKGW